MNSFSTIALRKLAVIGAGSVRCTPAVISSLASYFGERPLDIFLYDSDEERLDLFDRFARQTFNFNKTPHTLLAGTNFDEALIGASEVLITLGDNAACQILKASKLKIPSYPVEEALSLMRGSIPEKARVLSLLEAECLPVSAEIIAWPPEPTEAERRALPHQILRFLNGEEYPFDWIKQFAKSPVTAWLNGNSVHSTG